MIRTARFADTHAIVRFLQACHARSHYAKDGIVSVDVDEAKRLVATGISRHGHTKIGGCWVQIAEQDGNIDGLMFATLARVYSIGDKLMATDLFWVVNEHAAPGDGLALMRNMIDWATNNPNVFEIHIAASAVIDGNTELTGRLLKRMGMQEYGRIHRLELGGNPCLGSSAESPRSSPASALEPQN